MTHPTHDPIRYGFVGATAWMPASFARPWARWLCLLAGVLVAPRFAMALPMPAQATPTQTTPAQTTPAQASPSLLGSQQAAMPLRSGFGQLGQFFVSLGTESLLQGIWAPGFEQTFSIALEPAAGYFFTEHLYARLGFEMQLDQLPKAAQDVGDLRTFAAAVAPGLGGAWRLHPKVAVAPWVGVGLGRVWRSAAYSGYRSTLDIQASVPFVFDFLEHISFFLAPSYKQLLINQETFPEVSRQASLGGRLGASMGALGHW